MRAAVTAGRRRPHIAVAISADDRRVRDGLDQGGYALLTATRASRLLGARSMEKFRSPLDLDTPHAGESFAARAGHALEPVLLDWTAMELGAVRIVSNIKTTVHPSRIGLPDGRQIAWAAASLDGLLELGSDRVVVECKATARIDEWAKGVPPRVWRQVQWQLWVTGIQRAVVALADCGTRYKRFDIEADVEFAPRVLEAREWFERVALERFRLEEMK